MSDNREENRTVFTKEELWLSQAPNFNFELDGDELLERRKIWTYYRYGSRQTLIENY